MNCQLWRCGAALVIAEVLTAALVVRVVSRDGGGVGRSRPPAGWSDRERPRGEEETARESERDFQKSLTLMLQKW